MPRTFPSVRSVGWLFLSLLLFLALVRPAAAVPALSLTRSGLFVTGLTPGGRVVFFGVAFEHPDAFATIDHRLEEVVDEKGEGAVIWNPGPEALEAAVYVAVDVATGTYGVWSSEGDLVVEALPSSAAVIGGDRSAGDEFTEGKPVVEVLLVRAGQGAWIERIGDGTEADLDAGVEGEVTFALGAMTPVGASPPAPGAYEQGDLLLSLAPRAFTLSALQVSLGAPVASSFEVGR